MFRPDKAAWHRIGADGNNRRRRPIARRNVHVGETEISRYSINVRCLNDSDRLGGRRWRGDQEGEKKIRRARSAGAINPPET